MTTAPRLVVQVWRWGQWHNVAQDDGADPAATTAFAEDLAAQAVYDAVRVLERQVHKGRADPVYVTRAAWGEGGAAPSTQAPSPPRAPRTVGPSTLTGLPAWTEKALALTVAGVVGALAVGWVVFGDAPPPAPEPAPKPVAAIDPGAPIEFPEPPDTTTTTTFTERSTEPGARPETPAAPPMPAPVVVEAPPVNLVPPPEPPSAPPVDMTAGVSAHIPVVSPPPPRPSAPRMTATPRVPDPPRAPVAPEVPAAPSLPDAPTVEPTMEPTLAMPAPPAAVASPPGLGLDYRNAGSVIAELARRREALMARAALDMSARSAAAICQAAFDAVSYLNQSGAYTPDEGKRYMERCRAVAP